MSAPGGYIPFLVAPQKTGVDLSIDPWLTPQDAFQELLDGYQYRGVVYKRDGYSWFDAVPHVLPNAGAYQNITNITNGPNSIVTVNGNHGLTGTHNVRLHDVTGMTSPSGLPSINGTRWVGTFSGGGLATNQFSLNNDQAFGGVYGAASGTASYFPGNAVMCIANWIDENNIVTIMVLDTRRASIYSSSTNCLIPIGISDQFSGDDSQPFWWENYKAKIYFTNNLDTIFYWDTAATEATGLVVFEPEYNGVNTVDTCLMIKAIGSKLCLFNTVENGTRLPTRVRWCQDGADPTPGTGVGNPWDELTPGRGYFADLLDSSYLISLAKSQTNAFIMSQGEQFSTFYEMRPISDPKYAFSFTNVGVSRNVNSTFGTIILDKVITAVGNSGLLMTDGNNINRYDERIPDFVLNDIDQETIGRCFGVRNDRLWQTLLLYPSNVEGTGKNSRVLVYSYLDGSWSSYRIPMCVLGIVDYPKQDPEWDDYGDSLPDWSWQDFGDQTWASSFQRQVPWVVGGDYEGNIWWMDDGGGDAADNVAYLQEEDNGDPISFELTTRQWFPFAKEGLASQFGYVDFLVDADADTDVTVNFQVDNQGNNYLTTQFSCFPFENQLLAQIQNISLTNPCAINAPNHPFSTGDVVFIYGVQGTIELNDNNYTVTVVNSDNITINVNATGFTPYVSGGYVSNKPINASPFWLRVWCGQTGVFHQLTLTTTGVDESFGMHAICNWFKGSGRIYR